jgi:hypothetical protein
MAIKIIKNTMEEPIEMECEYCKSVFEYNYQDIQVKERNGLFGFEYQDRFVRCPVCKFDNAINKVKVEQKENEDMERMNNEQYESGASASD